MSKNGTPNTSGFKRAAEQGLAEAQVAIGLCYASGNGIGQDSKKAAFWLQKAAGQGLDAGQYYLGMWYLEGTCVEKDPKKAVHWLQKAAEQGHAKAQSILAACYEEGNGVKENLETSTYWHLKAAEQGGSRAQYNAGFCYYNGDGVEKNIETAVSWFLKAAEHYDAEPDASALYIIGAYYFSIDNAKDKEKNMETALHWLHKAANLGNANAQHHLARCYYSGIGVEENASIAASMFKKAAEQDYEDAQYELCLCYLKGEGVARNITQAAYWLLKASEHDDEEDNSDFIESFYAEVNEVPEEILERFLAAVKEQQGKQELAQLNAAHEQWLEQGLCINCGGRFGLFGKCKNCGADKLLGLRTSDEWKEIIAKSTRSLVVRIKRLDTPSKKLTAIRDVQGRIALETGHPLVLVKEIYEKYADKSVQKDAAFRK